ncbi:MAG: hypothetical protein WBW55_06640 [Desulfobaccales bacterium]
MRKLIIGHGPREVAAAEPGWMDLERLAQVEITSEDAGYSIESALIPGTGSGWRDAQPMEQTIRLLLR